MRNVWIIARRELRAYFISPIAYIILFLTLLTLSIFFALYVYYAVDTQSYIPDIRTILQLLMFPLFFLSIPAITMRSLAEENKTGTLELLLTAPVKDWELIVGKWLGSVTFFVTIILITWIYPIILNFMVSPGIDFGIVSAGYLGIFLITCALCAIGVFISSLFTNQIAALFAILGIMILLWIIGVPGQVMENLGGEILRYLSFPDRFYDVLLSGIIDLKDIIFYLSFTILGLYLGTMSIHIKRWK
jgi:ABC-2 type transport system permease protein